MPLPFLVSMISWLSYRLRLQLHPRRRKCGRSWCVFSLLSIDGQRKSTKIKERKWGYGRWACRFLTSLCVRLFDVLATKNWLKTKIWTSSSISESVFPSVSMSRTDCLGPTVGRSDGRPLVKHEIVIHETQSCRGDGDRRDNGEKWVRRWLKGLICKVMLHKMMTGLVFNFNGSYNCDAFATSTGAIKQLFWKKKNFCIMILSKVIMNQTW